MFLRSDPKLWRHKPSDPRDYIYAFLGHPLAAMESGLLIEPDYGKSLVDVYTDAALDLLQHPREGPGVLTSVRTLLQTRWKDESFPHGFLDEMKIQPLKFDSWLQDMLGMLLVD